MIRFYKAQGLFLGMEMFKLHILKHDKDNQLMLPIAVADPRLDHCKQMYTEVIDVHWLQSTEVSIVNLPFFDIDVAQLACTAACAGAQTPASMGLLVGCFNNEAEMQEWVASVKISDPIVDTVCINNITIKLYMLSKSADLAYSAFFSNHNISNMSGLYALFVDI